MLSTKFQSRISRCSSVANSGDGGIGTSCSDSTEGDGRHWITLSVLSRLKSIKQPGTTEPKGIKLRESRIYNEVWRLFQSQSLSTQIMLLERSDEGTSRFSKRAGLSSEAFLTD